MDLSALLLSSLSPATRKQAEAELSRLTPQPGFLAALLQLALDRGREPSVRLAGSIYLKNIAKTRWIEDEQPIPNNDKIELRSTIVSAMLALANPADKVIRGQIADAAALIAELDFPGQWPTLIDDLVNSLSGEDFNINLAILETCHSIFRRWRSQVRSDTLFTEINLVLSKFMAPFLQLYRRTTDLLLKNGPVSELHIPIANCAILLNHLFFDLCCQDLPPGIEDAHEEFFRPSTGLFHAFIQWDPPQLRGDPDDTTPSLPFQLKSAILEVVELFIKMYPEQLQQSPAVETFVQEIWSLIGGNSLPGVAFDSFVSQALRLIATTVRSRNYHSLFATRDTISSLVQGVVVPNVSLREHDIEQFEDDPLEYVRLDLAISATGTEAATRRQSAADLLQSLVSTGYEADTTEIVGAWINTGLQEYNRDKAANWKAKDSAVFLLIALATRGSTFQHGVTSTNTLVDVVKFFAENVYQDLEAEQAAHPILKVDAIRYILTFRNQLSKEQLLQVLPILARHLTSSNYVTYTYASITIDRVLLVKHENKLIFSQADIRDHAAPLIDALLRKVEAGGTAEKIAENDHVMRCVMRVVMTARQSLTPSYEQILTRLVAILSITSKNPSNPNFDQYTFEAVSALMRFIVGGNGSTLSTFENALFEPFAVIIQQEIDQYIPYAFQILAQMLSLHSGSVPQQYRPLLGLLFSPAAWQQKGSIPGLVKLLKAFLSRDAGQMVVSGQITSVFGVVQQRLIPSKINDTWGFELLQSVFKNVDSPTLSSNFRSIVMTLLTRMQTSKTDQYTYLFSYFMLFIMALNANGLAPEFVIETTEAIQPALWSSVFKSIILPQVPLFLPKDRKVAVVGLAKLLCQSPMMLREPNLSTWPLGFVTLVKLFGEPQHLTSKAINTDDAGFTMIDQEEENAGYQAAYTRLAASEIAEPDPVGYVQDAFMFVGEQLKELETRIGLDMVRQAISAASSNAPEVAGFLSQLSNRGFAL